MPAEAVVELREVGAFARTVGAQFCAEDAEHGLAALGGRPGTLLRQAVHGAGLLVVLQSIPATTRYNVQGQTFHHTEDARGRFKCISSLAFRNKFNTETELNFFFQSHIDQLKK